MDIVLAQNREVRRQLAALKREISDIRDNLLALHSTSHQSSSNIPIPILFHVERARKRVRKCRGQRGGS